VRLGIHAAEYTEILAGVPEDEQAKIAGATTARLYGFDLARLG